MELDFFGKNGWYYKCRPPITNLHTFLKAFFSERRPVQDAKKTYLRLNTVKTIPFSASHNRLGQIRECPLAWLLE